MDITCTLNLKISLRTRNQKDIDNTLALLRVLYNNEGYPLSWRNDMSYWLTSKSMYGAWVAECNNQILGHVSLGDSHEKVLNVLHKEAGLDEKKFCEISRLFVAPALQHSGLGEKLLLLAIEKAKELSLEPVLDVLTSNTDAQKFYEDIGWKKIGSFSWETWKGDQPAYVYILDYSDQVLKNNTDNVVCLDTVSPRQPSRTNWLHKFRQRF